MTEFIIGWLYNAAMCATDSPLNPWRSDHKMTRVCLDRECHEESCARREAICRFEAWYLRTFVWVS